MAVTLSTPPRLVQPEVRVERVGHEGEPVVIVDHFAPDPEALIVEAETLYFQPMGEYYPGVRAPVTPRYFDSLTPVLAPILREIFDARERMDVNRALYSISTTPPANLNLAQRMPHIDNVEGDRIAIIHYLSPDDRGGTAFFRHRSTGFETITPERHRPYLDALKADLAAHGEPPPGYITGDTSLFVQIAAFDGVFNRALIYRSRLLHCARLSNDAPLPSGVREGRLTVASFLTAR